jgi:hypothetical protein
MGKALAIDFEVRRRALPVPLEMRNRPFLQRLNFEPTVAM